LVKQPINVHDLQKEREQLGRPEPSRIIHPAGVQEPRPLKIK